MDCYNDRLKACQYKIIGSKEYNGGSPVWIIMNFSAYLYFIIKEKKIIKEGINSVEVSKLTWHEITETPRIEK